MRRRVILSIVILAVVVAVTAYMNRESIKDKDHAILSIKSEGKEAASINMDFIKELGEVEFKANLKTNGNVAEKHTYTGVPLKKIFEACNIEIKSKKQVVIKAVDGYTVALDIEEVLEEENVYMAYKMNGKLLGKKEDGGKGPYQVIISKDPYSQRWCKFVIEVEIL